MTGCNAAVACLLALLAVLGVMAFGEKARAHDQYHDWQRPDVGGRCCDELSDEKPHGDCRPTTAYMGDDGLWRARISPGRFVPVSPLKLVKPAADGRCHVCERNGSILCFAPCDPRS